MTCSGESLANVKWPCFPSSRITKQNLIWYLETLRWKFIRIPILLFPLPLQFPRYSHRHSHSHGNPVGPMGSQLFPFSCTSLIRNGRGCVVVNVLLQRTTPRTCLVMRSLKLRWNNDRGRLSRNTTHRSLSWSSSSSSSSSLLLFYCHFTKTDHKYVTVKN